jgi:hypothetical protein
MRFFNIDCHISVIADIAYIFNKLGHEVEDWSVSGHAGVMQKQKHEIKLNNGYIINECNMITREIGKVFYDTFKEKFKKYDGFICCYPTEFCMLYELFNKPIIIVNCIRYEHPFTRYSDNWSELNDVIESLKEKNLLHWVCNNKGDIVYTKYYTNIIGTWIPSLCEYTNSNFNPIYNKYIISNRTSISPIQLNNEAIHFGQIPRTNRFFSWKEKAKFKGIIHVPYHNGCMSIFEEYTSNIPLFFPSKKYGKQLFNQNKMMFRDLTFYRLYNLQEPDDLNNPNSLRNEKILNMWFDTSDFYDEENMPYIYYFDSLQHLNSLLATLTIQDLMETSNKMKEFNKQRKELVYNKWRTILHYLNVN